MTTSLAQLRLDAFSVRDPFGVIARQRQLTRDIVDAVRAGDYGRFADALAAMDYQQADAFTPALRGIAKLPRPSSAFQSQFLDSWLRQGDSLRDMTNGGNVLAAALRVLLPSYTGPALTIYRGDSWRSRCRRTYGLSWTTSIDIARDFSSRARCNYSGGSVLLEAMAPADAIICAPGQIDDRYAEREVVIEPRRLGKVNVVERFEHSPPTEKRR